MRRVFPTEVDRNQLARVREKLLAVRFIEAEVARRLGVADLGDLNILATPALISLRLAERDALDLAILLFLLQAAIPREELIASFGEDVARALRRTGILRRGPTADTVVAHASLFPVGDILVLADHRHRFLPWQRRKRPRQPVMYLGADSYLLARAALPARSRSTLDLCAGSGVQALVRAKTSDRVLGIDVNPRAVRFARFSAALNGIANASFVEGDLFEPVGNDAFDAIVANPPFVPSPERRLLYRDGGASGVEVLKRVVAGLPARLSRGGTAQVVSHLPERQDEPFPNRVVRWLQGSRLSFMLHRFGNEEPADYVRAQVRRPFGDSFERYAARFRLWLENLAVQKIVRVSAGLLSFRWHDAPGPAWYQDDLVPPPRAPFGGELQDLLRRKAFCRDPEVLGAIDRLFARVAPDLTVGESRSPETGAGTARAAAETRVRRRSSALVPELAVTAEVRELLDLITGLDPVSHVVQRFASRRGLDVPAVRRTCHAAILGLVERRIVDLPDALPVVGS